ncbi:MAG: HAMP domain-containing protein [Burkholderiales bacterium]|nr:HAMP domain-containing protein [Burkholderiales bacterium]
MTWWPRTLLWRSVLLIAALLLVAHLAWLQIFRASEIEPRALQAAQQVVSVVNLTRAALVTADPGRRFALLDELAQREGIQVYAGDPAEAVPALPDRPFLRIMEARLRDQLGSQTRLSLEREGIPGFWVSFRIDNEEFWVSLPRSRVERNMPLRWIGWGALVLALALIGAFLAVSRVNRPLRELTRAAEQLGRGATPPQVAEDGPAEIRTLSRAFNQMAADLRRQDEERALLLAGVSHDLRTPLARIRLALEMLDDRGTASLKAGVAEDIGDIDAAIGQFLDFARPVDAEMVTGDTDLNALARAVTERYLRSGRTVRFTPSALPPLPLRAQAMQRVLTNLIDNALRHGGGAAEVVTGRFEGGAYLEVLDRGPGIPATDAQRMLQPFTRMDSARSTSGTGLGLAIVDRIARLHGGAIRLLPREGGGLRARVELPSAAQAE